MRQQRRGRDGARRRARLACGLALSLAWLVGCGRTATVVGVVERRSVELSVSQPEKVVAILKKSGETVAAGDVIVRLDAEVAGLNLKAAQARLEAARAALRAAQRDFDRASELRRAGVGAERDLDLARRTYEESVALEAERSALLAEAVRRVDELDVRSDLPGVVDQLPFEIGETVPAGGVVAVVLAVSDPWVRVWLPADVVGRTVVGATASVEVEGLSGRLDGHLLDIAREAQYTPHFALTERERGHLVYAARIGLDGAPADLRPGLGATVRLRLGARSTAR